MIFVFKKEKGFTIIELIISIFILSVGVVGIFSAFSIVTILTSDSADRLAGTYLAQEGMEIVRNIRDTNWLNMDLYNCVPGDTSCGYTWVDGLTTLGACGTTGCAVDYASTSMSAYSSINYLCINSDGFYYQSTSGCDSTKKTKFKRKILIIPVTDVDGNPSHIIKIKVEVAWDQKATILSTGILAGDALSGDCTTYKNNCIIAEETLYDWYNYVNH